MREKIMCSASLTISLNNKCYEATQNKREQFFSQQIYTCLHSFAEPSEIADIGRADRKL